ncbi:hypothetical protein BgiMline_029672 [Biomphalaria glabrata]|nr:hypothetical protein BgiMline_026410 [Biomphalaria glabrata]
MTLNYQSLDLFYGNNFSLIQELVETSGYHPDSPLISRASTGHNHGREALVTAPVSSQPPSPVVRKIFLYNLVTRGRQDNMSS